ncbi:MAG: pyridoxal 5'-phosphate synthase glutaminase subunit PdxT [Actinobacteria bacterium]|nr:pyridoxal 5'-phosphate synthase glutaminase subunit PdxT [Actinomycetota bacterium]
MVTLLLRVGVLAVQGDVREHINSLTSLSVAVQKVRNPEELKTVNALVIPGGESTTISMLAKRVGLMDPLRKFVKDGFAVYGSCAGMIMLADEILDGRSDQETIGGLDITVRRNAFGRQVDSFETDLTVKDFDKSFRAIFIRAPWVERVGESVEVLAAVTTENGSQHPVMVRQGSVLATAFHPELTNDNRVHEYFVQMAKSVSAAN